MGQLRFSLELSSPAFLNDVPSADPKTVVSLTGRQKDGFRRERSEKRPFYAADPCGIRVPSLRGILEFWLRSLYGDRSPEEVFAIQESVFGSSGRGQGVRIRPAGCVGLKPGPLEFRTDPYSKLYLGYGPLQLVRQPSPTNPNGLEIATSYNRNACRDALLIDSTIPTRCSFVAHGSESALRLLQASLTLLHLFGGVGARSRRAWGSVSVVGDFIPAQGPNEDISAWFARTLEGVWALSGTTLPREAKVQPRFSAFSSKTQIRLLGPFGGDYTQVLDRFYGRFKEVRLWKGPGGRPSQLARTDHDLERAAVDTPSGDPLLAVPKRLAFGLPYQPRFRDENSIAYFGRPSEESEPNRRTIDRRASPLLLKVFRVGPTSHAGVALFLQASFFGASDYAIAAKGRSGTQPFPGYAAIAEFLGTDGQPWRKIRLP